MIVRRNEIQAIDFGGLRIRDYTAQLGCSSSVAFIGVPPGKSHAEAWSRRSDKYYLVIEGEVQFVIDGETARLGTGDFCWIRQGQRFSYANEGIDSAALVLVHTPAFRLEDDVFSESA